MFCHDNVISVLHAYAGGSPGPGSDATRSGNQAGAGAAGQSDPSQTSSPSNNPYDGTPRDGDD